ncbi:MAG: ATP-binding protein [Spirochaetota bacterium]
MLPKALQLIQGVPSLFPKINGFVLIPNETGALVGIISWMGIEYSPYPKRKGFRDFDVIDLPYPLRKISVNPLGILKFNRDSYELERGVFSFPSVGDVVVMPTQEQLQAIVENKDDRARIKIGTSPLAANAPIKVDPDKLFGRHLAVLGNTGSGKSCSVAGLIRWSVEEARKELKNRENINARFIILDPNGEYSTTFDDLGEKVRKFRVKLDTVNDKSKQLRVPAWMWNSYEWSAVTHASGKTQRPLLRRALRELRSGQTEGIDDDKLQLRRYLSSCMVSLKTILNNGPSSFSEFPGKQNFGELIKSIKESISGFYTLLPDGDLKSAINGFLQTIDTILSNHPLNRGYYPAFNRSDVTSIIESISQLSVHIGDLTPYSGPDEDSPVPFKGEDLPNHIQRLSQEQNVLQFLDFLIMRIRTMLSDTRMASVIGTEPPLNFTDWLTDYIGKNNAENGEIAIIDLSIVPSDVVHLVVAVIARIIFEALQRYRRMNGMELPTTIVMEEAHTFIRRYSESSDEISADRMCCQTFERIAREGRKFGLGLLLSSQRPSELSPTVLSQCNTFLLHRIVNDRDQELVRRLIPDNLAQRRHLRP